MASRFIFIDSTVADPQTLMAALRDGDVCHRLDLEADGLRQIAHSLKGRRNLEAILIFAHGAPGTLQLGALTLTEETLAGHQDELEAIGQALTPDGGVQFYACTLGQGQKGEAFVAALEERIGVPCAAASTPVGHADLGGSWILDVGTLSAPTFANSHWHGILGLTVTDNGIASPGRSNGEWRNSSAFAALRADGSVVTWGISDYGGDSSAVVNQLNGTGDVIQIFSTGRAFAALRADGSVVTWGSSEQGGDSSAIASQINGAIDVTQISSTCYAFAALRTDGSVVTWGDEDNGGDSIAVSSQLNGTIDVTKIFSTESAFAALRADGSVVTWGKAGILESDGTVYNYGGDSSAVSSQLNGTIDVTKIFSTKYAFAALRSDGSVVTWGGVRGDVGLSGDYGGNSSSVASQLNGTIDVTQIFSTTSAFAALRSDGSVVTWGRSGQGGDSSAVASALDGTIDVINICSTDGAFAALRTDGSVVTWGSSEQGGDSSAVAYVLNGNVIDVTQIFSTNAAFAALRVDGSVVTWGDSWAGGDRGDITRALNGTIDVIQICSTEYAFAALRADGSVITWGEGYGGDSSMVASQLNGTIDVTQILSNGSAFIAFRVDGSVVTWGNDEYDVSATSDQMTDIVSISNPYTNDIYHATTKTAPVISAALANRTITESTAFSFQLPAGSFSDADGDTLTYTATQANGSPLPSWLSFNATTRSFSGTAPAGSPNYTLRVTASDGQGGSVSDDFSLTTQTAAVANAITMTAVNGDSHTSEGGDTARYTVALSNALTAGSLSIVLTTQDKSEGRFLVNGQLADTQTLIFDSLHRSFTVTIQGIQDYDADGAASYRIQAVAANGLPRATSAQGVWTSAINSFNNNGTGHYETLINDPDRTPAGADRDIGVRLTGDQTANSVLTGFDGPDRLYGLLGDDRLDGGIGNDTAYGGYGDDELYGGAGNDKLYGEQDVDYLEGGLGDDTLDGGLGADTMIGGAGNDTYYADDTGDRIIDQGAVTDVDRIIVTQTIVYTLPTNVENASLDSGSGNSGLIGNALNNILTGNGGNNTLSGGGGNDTLDGGAGNDTYIVDSQGDSLTDSAGIDTVMENLSRYSLTAGFEKLAYTGSGACALTGNTLDNVLSGGTGDDSLNGGVGNDTLIGGAGRDTLTGGTGADVFRFGSLGDAGDRISDFVSGTDKLQFVSRAFGGLTATALRQGRLVCNSTGTASGTNAQFVFNSRSSALTYDANGTGSGGATTIATLTNVRSLSANDFLMVAS